MCFETLPGLLFFAGTLPLDKLLTYRLMHHFPAERQSFRIKYTYGGILISFGDPCFIVIELAPYRVLYKSFCRFAVFFVSLL
jgi:hypothetical protein